MVLVGTDVQSIPEFESTVFVSSGRGILTAEERQYAEGQRRPGASRAGLFCAKEAALKVLTAVPGIPRFTLWDIAIAHDPSGRPLVRFSGALAEFLAQRAFACDVSISHSGDYATATIIAQCRPLTSN